MSDKYLYYCPICGAGCVKEIAFCLWCNKQISPVRSKYEITYYAELAEKEYGDNAQYQKVFEKEICQNPQLSIRERDVRIIEEEEYKINTKKIQIEAIPENAPNIPKCPTCSSTNIKSISGLKRGLHGYLFGIFSPTSLAQFECKDCGYKW